jgi:hypothetical protein
MPRGMGTVDNIQRPGVQPKRLGIRLFHKTLKNCTIVIIHPTRKYKIPYLCPTCNKQHERKAIHLNLDDQGSVIVSAGVFKHLQESGLPDLSVANEVNNPPSQTLYMGSNPRSYDVEEIDMGSPSGRFTVIRKKIIGR